MSQSESQSERPSAENLQLQPIQWNNLRHRIYYVGPGFEQGQKGEPARLAFEALAHALATGDVEGLKNTEFVLVDAGFFDVYIGTICDASNRRRNP